jgi:hypothetical protein
VLAGLLLLTLPGSARADEPTAQEQLFIYELNRARSDPPGWAQEYGLQNEIGGDGQPADLDEVSPSPPLAVNEDLVASARFHSTEMADNNYFNHQSAVTGDWPNKMARDAGYPLPLTVQIGQFIFGLPDTSNQIESIAAGFGPGRQDLSQAINALILLIVDAGVPSLGHRKHLLAMTLFNTGFTEVGTGYAANGSATFRNYWSIHTGLTASPETFLTGVTYDDVNQNGLYDVNEGLPGVAVDVGGASTQSNASGGWSLPVTSGTYDLTCSGGSFAGTSATRVGISDASRHVDCISGQADAIVDFTVPEPAAWLAQSLGLAGALLLARRRRRGAAV